MTPNIKLIQGGMKYIFLINNHLTQENKKPILHHIPKTVPFHQRLA